MFKNRPMFRIIWWSAFTLIADLSALRGLYEGRADGISVIAATIMTFGLIYLIAAYKIDGPAGMKLEHQDERIRIAANKSRSNGFLVMFICTWFLAILISEPGLSFLLQNINLTLAAIAMIGMLVHLVSFVWYKYRVQ